ncbi:MAG: tetratricopeptide repeat protein [Polyangiales bacterium]
MAAQILVFCAPHVVRADEPTGPSEHAPSSQAPPEAIDHYARGREYFRVGQYAEAIVELKAALELDPTSPNLAYNVAYTSELLGNVREAIDYYRKYLANLPQTETEERQKTLATLRRLEGRLAAEAAPPPATTETKPTPAPASTTGLGRADAWFWATLGGGAALLVGGTVTGVLALERRNEARAFVVGRDGTLAQRNKKSDQASTFALATDILLPAGAVVVASAALLFLLREPGDEPRGASPTASLTTNGHTTLITLSGQF